VGDLITFYGYPTSVNYNDWYQAYNFLQYGNKLLVSRAANIGGTATIIDGVTIDGEVATGPTVVLTDSGSIEVGDAICFEDDTNTGTADLTQIYLVINDGGTDTITLDRGVEETISDATDVFTVEITMNGIFEAVSTDANGEAVTVASEYFGDLLVIENASEFESKETSIQITNSTDSKLKFISRNPGAWGNDIEIAIANPVAFGVGSFAFDGIILDDLFEYIPTGTEVGIIIKIDGVIVEVWTVDFDENAKDHNNKSTYVETIINNGSNYIFVKNNTTVTDVKDYCFSVNTGVCSDTQYIDQSSCVIAAETWTPHTAGVCSDTQYIDQSSCVTAAETWTPDHSTGTTIELLFGSDSSIQADDLLNAFEIFGNKEELEIDIVIGNELDDGKSAYKLVDDRKDCIAFIGANYEDTVGKISSTAVSNLIKWRKTGGANENNMFAVACGNYKYQYDRYNDKFRWINIASDIAGLRAQTSMNRASWWASAGLERGQIKNVTKLAFNPDQGQRDMLYKNSINPIVSFPGQGTVMWGQKTLLSKPSSFDRVNVRGLFNTVERALSKMAKHQIMEFNDNFTRNRIISMIKPFLTSVQAGRGIQQFLVICDESNNTPDIISRNQLIVDIYIKPTYVAEFINLRFTNAGTNSFSEIVGGT
jgi:hypothetical protein